MLVGPITRRSCGSNPTPAISKMRCPNCKNEIIVQVATNVKTKDCKILTNFTSVLTVQCEKCKIVFQVPVQNKSILSVKEGGD